MSTNDEQQARAMYKKRNSEKNGRKEKEGVCVVWRMLCMHVLLERERERG